MTYSPGLSEIVPPMVSSFTFGWGPRADERSWPNTPVSSSFGASGSTGYFFPILVPVTCVARRLWWANGSTVSASYNIDVGIYRDNGYKPGTRLVSAGSTAQGTASQVQFVDITDTTLPPGLYWLAISCDALSATLFCDSGANSRNAVFLFEKSACVPLPSSITTVTEAVGVQYFVFGFATTSSP